MLRLQGLPFDIFPHVFASLDSDTRSLYSCTLVSRMFRDAATPSLYRKIYLDSVRDHDGVGRPDYYELRKEPTLLPDTELHRAEYIGSACPAEGLCRKCCTPS